MDSSELISIREALGLSHEALGAALDVHRTTIQRWERGERPVPKAVAIALRAMKPSKASIKPHPATAEMPS